MKRFTLAVAALLAAGAAGAQIYQWKDENGKTVISDKPPIGNTQAQKTMSAETPESTPQKSLAERDLEFRKRQKEAREQADKSQKEQAAAQRRKDGCDQARRYLLALESGDRITQRDERGERSYLDDAQREQELAKTRKTMQEQCK